MSALGKAISVYGWTSNGSVAVYGWDTVLVADTFVGHPKITRALALQNILTFSQAVMSRIQLVCKIADKQTLKITAATKQPLEVTCTTKQTTKATLSTRSNIKVTV